MLSRARAAYAGDAGGIAMAVGLLLLLLLVLGAMLGERGGERLWVQVTPAAAPEQGAEVMHLRLDIPETLPDAPGWVVWIPRVPQQTVRVEGHDWSSAPQGFFHPGPEEGGLPGGFAFDLPQYRAGPLELSLHVVSGAGFTPRPRVVRADEVLRLERASAAGSAAVYAGLLMLAVLALAMLAAARDRAFLALSACAGAMLLMLAAFNGHLYALPGLSWLGGRGVQGVWALLFVFLAAWLWLLREYAGPWPEDSRTGRLLSVVLPGLLLAAGISLAGVRLLDPVMLYLANAAWMAVGIGSLVVLGMAGRRLLPSAWLLPGLVGVMLLLALLLRSGVFGADVTGSVLVRWLFQAGMVAVLATCCILLVQRISEHRRQRDRDRRQERAESGRRVQCDAARDGMIDALQSGLRQGGSENMGATAFRIMAGHLLPLLPTDLLVLVAHGFHGQDILLTEPAARIVQVRSDLRTRAPELRRRLANGLPFQQSLILDEGVMTEAVIPLKIRSPAWGALILRRAGTDGFAPDEMALATEFCRIAQSSVEHEIEVIALRQSAETDPLTGCLSRRSIDQWLERSLSGAGRERQPLSLLLVDVEGFADICGCYGNTVGKVYLRTAAAGIRQGLEEPGLAGCHGDGRFLVILPGSGEMAARQAAERLCASVGQLVFKHEEDVLAVRLSIGVATRRDGERSAAAILERADAALRAARLAGGNCVRLAPAKFA